MSLRTLHLRTSGGLGPFVEKHGRSKFRPCVDGLMLLQSMPKLVLRDRNLAACVQETTLCTRAHTVTVITTGVSILYRFASNDFPELLRDAR